MTHLFSSVKACLFSLTALASLNLSASAVEFKTVEVNCVENCKHHHKHCCSENHLFQAKEERTLSIIKPDGVAGHHIGEIITIFENAGLRVVASKMIQMTEQQAREFYFEHHERPFYLDLVRYMTSGPIIVQVLEGPNAIAMNRELMGPTDRNKAASNTIRGRFGRDLQHNAVHGSDSPASAVREIAFFFSEDQIFSSSH